MRAARFERQRLDREVRAARAAAVAARPAPVAAAPAAPAGFVCPPDYSCRPKPAKKSGWNYGLLHHLHSGETFGPGPVDDLLAFTAEDGHVRQATDGRWYWASENFPASAVSLRAAAPENVVIIDTTPDRPRVLGEVDRLQSLVDDLLLVARMSERGVHTEGFSLLDTVRDVAARRRGVAVRVVLDRSAPALRYSGAALLAETGLPADRLVLEITESSVMEDADRTLPVLGRLCDLGVTLSLDDFGAGFGTFSYLKHLPFDEVKIDGEFVSGCTQNRTDQLVIDAVVRMADGLEKETVAEFTGAHLVRGFELFL